MQFSLFILSFLMFATLLILYWHSAVSSKPPR
jgi:hypothetical protein